MGADEGKSAADELLGHLHSKPPEPHKRSKTPVALMIAVEVFARKAAPAFS